jgi:osmotically-inducible protein OsmY
MKGRDRPAIVKEEPMDDLSTDARRALRPVGAGLPETLEEAEELAASIERAVQRETGRRIRNLTVEVNRDGVRLRGHCTTYYCKQLAQHAAMAVSGGDRLTNSIEVA